VDVGSRDVKMQNKPKLPKPAFPDYGVSAYGPPPEKTPLYVKLMRWLGR